MILESFSSMLASLSFAGSHPRDPVFARLLGMGTSNNAGVRVDEQSVMALPAIKRAVQIITDKMFGMPWYVFNELEDGKEFNRNHPAWNCIHWRANEEMSASSLRQILVQWALVWGNGCAWIDRGSSNLQMYPLRPDKTKPVRLTERQARVLDDESMQGRLFIETEIGGEKKLLDYSDVFHLRGLTGNGFWGYDIVELLSETFAGAIAKDEFSNRYFGQGANPAGFIEMPGGLDEEAEGTFMASMAKAMSGLGKAHKIIMLEEGAKFHPVTIDPEKSQLLEGKQFDIRLLAMAIGIKPHKLVDGANSAFASLEQANHEHKDDDILPWVNKMRDEARMKLLSEEESRSGAVVIDVDDEALDWVPFKERAEGTVELYNNGLITKEEGRARVNFGPSRSKRAKQYRIPMNIVYEDDQALVSSSSASAASESTQDEHKNKASEDYRDVAEAYLDRIDKRLDAQAKSKAKDPTAFINWLDALQPEEGPPSIQGLINDLYRSKIKRFNELATTKTAEDLANAI